MVVEYPVLYEETLTMYLHYFRNSQQMRLGLGHE